MIRTVIGALVCVSVLACGGSSSEPTSPASASLAGAFTLRSVNGSALPFTYQSGTNSATITSDVLTVVDDETWTENGAYTVTINGSSSHQVIAGSGTWARLGTSVSFVDPSGALLYIGQFTGSGFTLSDGMFTYMFSK